MHIVSLHHKKPSPFFEISVLFIVIDKKINKKLLFRIVTIDKFTYNSSEYIKKITNKKERSFLRFHQEATFFSYPNLLNCFPCIFD